MMTHDENYWKVEDSDVDELIKNEGRKRTMKKLINVGILVVLVGIISVLSVMLVKERSKANRLETEMNELKEKYEIMIEVVDGYVGAMDDLVYDLTGLYSNDILSWLQFSDFEGMEEYQINAILDFQSAVFDILCDFGSDVIDKYFG